jgi:hypothetical protein
MAISKVALLIILFIGILLLTVNMIKSSQEQEKPKIEYRYIPRTFDEEMDDRGYVSDIFATMFSQQSPWVHSNANYDRVKQKEINKFFISQY